FAAATSPASLADYYRAVADASSVPVLVYNIPKYTHLPLEAGLLRQLAAHPNIVGVKDSAADAKNLAAYRDAVPDWSVLVSSSPRDRLPRPPRPARRPPARRLPQSRQGPRRADGRARGAGVRRAGAAVRGVASGPALGAEGGGGRQPGGRAAARPRHRLARR